LAQLGKYSQNLDEVTEENFETFQSTAGIQIEIRKSISKIKITIAIAQVNLIGVEGREYVSVMFVEVRLILKYITSKQDMRMWNLLLRHKIWPKVWSSGSLIVTIFA
jgi:hypothetical protein